MLEKTEDRLNRILQKAIKEEEMTINYLPEKSDVDYRLHSMSAGDIIWLCKIAVRAREAGLVDVCGTVKPYYGGKK